jgi:Tol biopolymer transport system component
MDGGNPKQLTQGNFSDYSPNCAPDGQWVVFNSWRSGNPRMWKVPIEGGEPAQISDQPLSVLSFSPDGKLLLCNYYDEQVSPPRWRPALASFESGQVAKVLDISL